MGRGMGGAGRDDSRLRRAAQPDAADMDWTFPIHSLPEKPPGPEAFRQLLGWSLQVLADKTRSGSEVLGLGRIQDEPVPGWSHWHAHPELFVQVGGVSRFAVPGGAVAVTAGTALLFPPFSAHREAVAAPPFANLVIALRGQYLYGHLAVADPVRPDLPLIVRPDAIACDDFGAACLRRLARSHGDARLRATLFTAFCAWGADVVATAPPIGGGSDLVRRARELIAARADNVHCSVAQVASWVGCHPDHLARLFRRETGETLVGHIQRLRLERARELLGDPRIRIAEAARLSGFADPAYFSRVWRRRYGGTPGAERRR